MADHKPPADPHGHEAGAHADTHGHADKHDAHDAHGHGDDHGHGDHGHDDHGHGPSYGPGKQLLFTLLWAFVAFKLLQWAWLDYCNDKPVWGLISTVGALIAAVHAYRIATRKTNRPWLFVAPPHH